MQQKVLQILPELDCGGVETGTLQVAKELVQQNYKSIVVSGPGRLVDQLIAEGSEPIEMPVGKKSIFSLRLIPVLRQLFIDKKIDIIHARSRLPAWLAYLAWKKINPETRPVFITTVHGPYTVNRYSQIMTAGQRVIAISEYIKEYIINNYPSVDINKIEVIHRGISKKEYPYNYKPTPDWLNNWQQKYQTLNNKFIITLPARITRWKGHNDFIDIITKCRHRGLNVHGLIAGGADQKKQRYLTKLKTLVSEKNIVEHITFLGQRDDMKDIMSISDVVVSLANIPEAFGRTALEALSLGVPVIAYKHGGAAEVLGEIFPEGNAIPLNTDSVVELIEKFYRVKPRVNESQAFTLDQMLAKTLSVYNSFN